MWYKPSVPHLPFLHLENKKLNSLNLFNFAKKNLKAISLVKTFFQKIAAVLWQFLFFKIKVGTNETC